MKKFGIHFVDKHGQDGYDDVWVQAGVDPLDQFDADYGDNYARITMVIDYDQVNHIMSLASVAKSAEK